MDYTDKDKENVILTCCGCQYEKDETVENVLEYCVECKRAYNIDVWRQQDFSDLYRQ